MDGWRRCVAVAGACGLAVGVVVSAGVGSAGPAQAVPGATADGGPGFRGVSPVRVLDTRSGLGAPAGPVGGGRSIDVRLTGTGGVPTSGVAAVVFNLTAVAPTSGGYLTVYPTGTTRPTASTLNFAARQTVANEVIATLGTSGTVTIYNNTGSTHVLADITGWFATGSYYTGLTPTRLLDTRTGNGAVKAPVGGGHSIDIQITGRGGIPATADAVAINLTGTQPTSGTFVTAYPTGEPRPTTSNLNLVRGQTAAVLDVAKIGTDGRITLYNNTGTVHLIADVTGWFAPNGQFTPITPTRTADTRTSLPIGPGEARVFVPRLPVPREDAWGLVLSVTAVDPTSSGFLTVGSSQLSFIHPSTSTVNVSPRRPVANLVMVPLDSSSGSVFFVYNSSGNTHVVIDVLGWFAMPLRATPPQVVPRPYVSIPYTVPLAATGGVTPYSWTVTAGTLPTGLTLASTGPTTAAITGIPTGTGTNSVTIRVSDPSGMFDDRALDLVVNPPTPGVAWGLGRNDFGELGNGDVGGSQPLRVDLSGVVTAVAANGSGGYALRSDGTVWAWGQGPAGQLGNGTTDAVSRTPVQVSGLTGITAIASALGSGFALASDGTVWAWGHNLAGELGDGTTVNRTTPVRVSGLTGITAIAGGGKTGYALASDGTVWAWGDNRLGQLGNGTTVSSTTPVRVSGLTGITAIAGGVLNGYALASDGTVWAWGSNGAGQLGDGTLVTSNTPVHVTGLTGVTAIAGGDAVGYAIRADGTAWAWGLNGAGQLGDGTLVTSGTPVRVAGLTGVTAISGSFGYTAAVRSDGTAWTWGDRPGQAASSSPVMVASLPPVTAISAGEFATFALGGS